MKRVALYFVVALSIVAFLLVGCSQPAAPAATSAPAKAAEPTKAPAAAPTTAAAVPTTAAAAAPTAVPAKKVDWPVKGRSLQVIMPVAAGSGMDILGRVTAPLLEKELGMPVEVVNKAGASQQVAMTEMVKSKPDGYTIMYSGSPTPQVSYFDPSRQAPFTRKDFAPIAVQVVEPTTFTVRPDSPIKTLDDLVQAAKANPGKVKVALSGKLSGTQFTLMALEKAAGIKFAGVFFDGQGPMNTALLGGHVDASVTFVGDAVNNFKSGQVRVLALNDTKESPLLPGIKTAESMGYKVYVDCHRGLVAPGTTPKEIVDIIGAAVKKVGDNPDLKKKALEIGYELTYIGPAEYAKWWDEEDGRMKPMIEQAIKENAD